MSIALARREREAPPGAALGNIAKFADGTASERYRRLRRERKRSAGMMTPRRDDGRLPRVATCGRPIGSSDVTVLVGTRDGHRHASYSGVETCGGVWVCPTCSAKIRAERASEVREAMARHMAMGGGAYLVTVTTSHSRGDALAYLLDGMASAWRSLTASRMWRDKRSDLGIVGYIRALEITLGENGWHPHHHMLVLTDAPATAQVAEELCSQLLREWTHQIDVQGLSLPNEHGVDVKAVGKEWQREAAVYVSKVLDGFADEVSGAMNKRARGGHWTPMELLDHPESPRARAKWAEYVRATKGRRCLWFSRGLRERLGMGREATDVELLERDGREDTHVEAIIPRCSYLRIWYERPGELARALELVESGKWSEAAGVFGCFCESRERGRPLVMVPLDSCMRKATELVV